MTLRALTFAAALCCLAGLAKAHHLPKLEGLLSEGAAVSALVVDLGEREVLAQTASEQAVIPASVTKLYLGALALETWGPNKSFATRLLRRGELSGGTLQGDLVIQGGGDPLLGNEQLWRLAREAARHGLKRVTGDLIVDVSYFGAVPCSVNDRCEARQASSHAYDAPLSALGVNFNLLAILVTPAPRSGQDAAVELDPYPLPFVEITGRVKTATGRPSLQVRRRSQGEREILEVKGKLPPASTTEHRYRSTAQPEHMAGELLRAFLRREGIEVEGRVRTRSIAAEEPETLIFLLEGRPLEQILDAMMAYSNNYIADTLALDLLIESRPESAVTLPAAGKLLEDYARNLSDSSPYGTASSGALLRDGSGLDPSNRLSAQDVVALLDHLYRRTQDFPDFLGSLIVPTHAFGRSIQAEDEAWMHRLAVKSGGLGEPVPVNTLAGYFRFDGGGWGAFAVLVNATENRPNARRAEIFGAFRSDLEHLRQSR